MATILQRKDSGKLYLPVCLAQLLLLGVLVVQLGVRVTPEPDTHVCKSWPSSKILQGQRKSCDNDMLTASIDVCSTHCVRQVKTSAMQAGCQLCTYFIFQPTLLLKSATGWDPSGVAHPDASPGRERRMQPRRRKTPVMACLGMSNKGFNFASKTVQHTQRSKIFFYIFSVKYSKSRTAIAYIQGSQGGFLKMPPMCHEKWKTQPSV